MKPGDMVATARQLVPLSRAVNPRIRAACEARLAGLRQRYAELGPDERSRVFTPDVLEALRMAAEQLAGEPDQSLSRALRDLFGYEQFRPGQEEVIRTVLAGLDCLAVMPTGAGKSITFQMPARLLRGTTLVISPLIALMKDQVDALLARGLHATYLNSSLTDEERRRRILAIRRGEMELVYAAPEGVQAYIGSLLETVRPRLAAVDEAHCISEWGHDFRPAYRNLAGLKQRFGGVPILALTATATHRVQRDIAAQLGMDAPATFRGSFFRPNLHVYCAKKGNGPKVGERILEFVRSRTNQSGIIYCLSRKTVDELARVLSGRGVRAGAYHAGLEPDARHAAQERFRRNEIQVMVATIAFGMGIDKSDIRYVIHRDMPRSVEGFAQEIGRAGRDGQQSDCILFYSWPDVLSAERMAAAGEGAAPQLLALRGRQAREMYRFAEQRRCRHQALAAHFGERIGVCQSHCDVCLGSGLPVGPPAPKLRPAHLLLRR